MTILFDARLNTGSTWTRAGSNYSNGIDSLVVNQDIARASAYSQIVDAERGLVWGINAEPADYYSVSGKLRVELSAPNSGVAAAGPPRDTSDVYMAKLTDLWFRWAFRLDDDFWFASDARQDSRDVVLVQMHDAPGTSSRVAPVHLLLVNDQLELHNSYSETVNYDRLLWRAPAIAGQWYTLVLNVYLDDTAPATGYLHCWVNGRKVFVETGGLNTYATSNSPGPWPKDAGIYLPHGLPSGFPGNALRSEGLVVGDAYASYDAFMAACGLPDTELEMVAPGLVGAA